MRVQKPAGSGQFQNAPEGYTRYVLVDVVDMGEKDTGFGPKMRVKLVGELAEKMEDGRPFLISDTFNASLYKSANQTSHLRKAAEALLGRPMTNEEADDFDLDDLIGKTCSVHIEHFTSDRGTFANVKGWFKNKPTDPEIVPSGGYVRVKDRTEESAPRPGAVRSQQNSRPPAQQQQSRPAQQTKPQNPRLSCDEFVLRMNKAATIAECNVIFGKARAQGDMTRDNLIHIGEASRIRKAALEAQVKQPGDDDDDIPF